MRKLLVGCIALLYTFHLSAQTTYQFDIPEVSQDIKSGHLKMGNPGDPAIEVNNRYMTIGGKPVLPVMGEIHYSRVPQDRWEEYLLKMKANGINIIASYVLWIHHEEIEGEFDWSDNKDLRAFVEMCKKHDLMAVARIGPWCHAEVRNGGTPDWIFTKEGLKDRSNEPQYQEYAKKWYTEISKQIEGLYYKDGGPIMAIQLENEYRRGPGGDPHILWLKQTALEVGMDVPMYTVTGWGPASVPKNEVIPLYGGYPTSPWTTNIKPVDKSNNFSFETAVNDPTIGGEGGNTGLPQVDLTGYPYFTCELGVGNQISYHRRPIINPLDGVTIAMAKVGSGSNLPGYYVFAGGSNPKGQLTSLEEDQDETGYWNRYPKVSYDFQAAIKETGELAQSYHEIKAFHYFLNAFGDQLAAMKSFINPDSNKEGLQLALRTDGERGFLFGLNYMRNRENVPIADVSFDVTLGEDNIKFPSVNIPADCNFIWPVNLKMGDRLLKSATCQPVTKIESKRSNIWVFVQNADITPIFKFDKAVNGSTSHELEPSLDNSLRWIDSNGNQNQLVVIPSSYANQIWMLENQLFITEADIYKNQDNLVILSKKEKGTILTLQGNKLKGLKKVKSIGLFDQYEFTFEEIESFATLTKVQPLDDAHWLKTSVDEITTKTELYHRFFRKKFELNSTSAIKNAQFEYFSDQPFRIRVNEKWVNQPTETGALSSLDLTGFLKNGQNSILIDYDFHDSESAFAGQLKTEFYNTDQVSLVTDTTWLMSDNYTYPRAGDGLRRATSATIASSRATTPSGGTTNTNRYELNLSYEPSQNLNSLYLNIDYTGDIAEMRKSGQLIADNYWNGTIWSTNILDRGNGEIKQSLAISISPFKDNYKIFFDEKPKVTGKAEIRKVELIPEYKKVLKIQ